jgi:pyruvate dehydrogenase E2 component (dihydrolipoamide acetyltransferase)
MPEEKVYEVVMPKLGLIMTEAELVSWYCRDGDWIDAGEVLFDLESDKSTIEIEAPASGYVQILIKAGEVVPVMTPVALIKGEKTAAGPAVSLKPTAVAGEAQEPAPEKTELVDAPADKGVRASPKARILAQARGIVLSDLTGTGPRGMIVVADLDRPPPPPAPIKATPVARKLAAKIGVNLEEIVGTGPGGRITREDVQLAVAPTVDQTVAAPMPPAPTPEPAAPLPLTGLRGIIADRLSTGWRERPQVTLISEVDGSALVSARAQFVAEVEGSVSFNTFFVMAAARALREFPYMNVRLTDTGLVQLEDVNVGVAVDSERGLLVPVLRDADKKSLVDLDRELQSLGQRALDGKALPDELTGGTFTVTNLGIFGVDAFTPIINPPEAAILGVGRIAPRPFVEDRQLGIRETVTLSLSFDHRLVDGAPAARFLQRIGELIERPAVLVSGTRG